MLSFTQDQLYTWLNQFIWPFGRLAGLMSTAPIFGESSIPIKVKVGLAILLTLTIAPSLNSLPQVAPTSITGLWLLGQQIIVGLALGFTVRSIFSAVQTAGEFVGLQMGLSFATFFDPSLGANTAVVSRLFNIVATLVFLALNGHLLLLSTLVHTFDILPIQNLPLHQNGWGILIEWGAEIFISGLLLALPLIAALLTINLALGILNRAAPQLSVFSVGFPLSLLIGLILLAIVLPQTPSFLEQVFEKSLRMMESVSNGFSGKF